MQSPPDSNQLQQLWDTDPQSFYLQPMPGFEQNLPWSAAQWAIASLPSTFWNNKIPPTDATLWTWALHQAPARALHHLATLRIPVPSDALACLVERQCRDDEFKKPAMASVFLHALDHPDAWTTPSPSGVYAAPGIVASHAKSLLSLLKHQQGIEWRHPSTQDTLLHTAVQTEWLAGLRQLLALGVHDAPNAQGTTAKTMATNMNMPWPSNTSQTPRSRIAVPSNSKQMDLF